MLKMDLEHKQARSKYYDFEYERIQYAYELACCRKMTTYAFCLISLCKDLKVKENYYEKIGWEQE